MKQKRVLPKIQHYVPRFLLMNFVKEKKAQIWVFDKQSKKTYRTNIKNIASECGFYDLESESAIHSLEPNLGHLEGKTAKLIKRIVSEESIKWLSSDDRTVLSVFVLVQQMRTLHARKSMLHMDELLQKKIKEMGCTPEEVENYRPLDNEGVRFFSIKMLSNVGEFVPHIYEKEWILLKGKHKNPFYISDNPITLQNMKDFGLRGNLGLAVEGIEIYLPLSSTLTLAMYCPSLVRKIRAGYRRYKSLSATTPKVANALINDPFYLEKMMVGFDEGAAVECIGDNILNLNYLQVRYAERQVYCESDSFWLVHDMLKESSIYKTGPRMQTT